MTVRPLLAWHGDDLTGSVDVLDAVAACGLRGALFLRPPTTADLEQFAGLQAVGVAGLTRTLSPAGIRAELAVTLPVLAALSPYVLHLKVCSTFDSSPEIGSIGAAIEAAVALVEADVVPLLVGAPALGRYVAFGNLFARSGWDSAPHRLDRHPTMAHHPTTPMDDADLLGHLARQTALSSALLDVLVLDRGEEAVSARFAALRRRGVRIVLLDVLYPGHLSLLGGLLWNEATRAPPLLTVGSSGVEHALATHWREAGLVAGSGAPTMGPADVVLAVVGSCSPVSARQIRRAVSSGFVEIEIPADRLVGGSSAAAVGAAALTAVAGLRSGRSVVVHSGATGSGAARVVAPAIVGAALGRVVRSGLEAGVVRRVVVAGGDTSGQVLRTLGIDALEVAAPFQTTMPLLHAWSAGRRLDAELISKGGQTGGTDFFVDVVVGRPYKEERP